jgi:hypothetical protein
MILGTLSPAGPLHYQALCRARHLAPNWGQWQAFSSRSITHLPIACQQTQIGRGRSGSSGRLPWGKSRRLSSKEAFKTPILGQTQV